MRNDEISLQTSVNKLKILKTPNRVSFSESIKGSSELPENEYEMTLTSSLPPSTSSPALKRTTPVLFSTNRGLHLRVTSTNINSSTTKRGDSGGAGGSGIGCGESCAASMSRSRSTTTTNSVNSSYSIAFCDLERWSTNRANTISLEDTFTIARPAVVPHSAASGSLVSNSLRFLPQSKSNSIRYKGYARFDVE